MDNSIIDKTEILARAKLNWDEKNKQTRIRAGSKYRHFLSKHRFPTNDWENEFDELTKYQKNVLIKGELIRLYDSLPNTSKTRIMRDFGLSTFSSKWYKLPYEDKKVLLNCVIIV